MSTDIYGKGFSSATPWLTPVRPLHLVSIGISERDDRRQLEPGWFQVDQIGVRTDTGNEEILDSFDSKGTARLALANVEMFRIVGFKFSLLMSSR